LGLLLGWYRRLNAMFEPFVTMLNATPRVALLPLIILWLGIGMQSKVAAVFLGAFFPLVVNVMAGVRAVDETLLKCARSFGASDRQIFTTLALPSSVPFIVAAMRLAVGRGLVGVVVGEMLASTAGIGHMMALASATFQTDKMFVGLLLLAGFGYFLTELLKRLEKRYESWRP
jgi:NitT/TauT family transport system permease protein